MNDATVQIQLLGGFTVRVNDSPIHTKAWHSRRTRNLIKLLALAPNQRLGRDQVLDALWPDSAPTAAANNLHQTLFAARKIFDAAGAPGCLRFEDGLLSLGEGASVDVDAFEAAAGQAEKSQDPALFQSCGKGSFKETVLPALYGSLRLLSVMSRNDVHDAAESVRAVNRGAGAKKHFDPFDVLPGHGEVGVVMSRLRVVDPHPIHQDQNLRERGSAHGEIGLQAKRRA